MPGVGYARARQNVIPEKQYTEQPYTLTNDRPSESAKSVEVLNTHWKARYHCCGGEAS
jgi:hypothetical protein